jgi:hypothetical protein
MRTRGPNEFDRFATQALHAHIGTEHARDLQPNGPGGGVIEGGPQGGTKCHGSTGVAFEGRE